LTRQAARREHGVDEVIAGERDWTERLLAGRSLEHWLGVWEKVAAEFAGAETVNLDRKQVWVGALLDIAAAARR
jgi:hypothetical protein